MHPSSLSACSSGLVQNSISKLRSAIISFRYNQLNNCTINLNATCDTPKLHDAIQTKLHQLEAGDSARHAYSVFLL